MTAPALAAVLLWAWSGVKSLSVSKLYRFEVTAVSGELTLYRWYDVFPARPLAWRATEPVDGVPRWSWWVSRDQGMGKPRVDWSWGVVRFRVCGPGVVPGWTVQVMLWPVVLACGAPGVWMWWSGRRALRRQRRNECQGCGYSLAGLGEGVRCPECGAG